MCACVHVYVLASQSELTGFVFIELGEESLNPTNPQITSCPIHFVR